MSVARAPLFEVRGVRFTHSPYWHTSVTHRQHPCIARRLLLNSCILLHSAALLFSVSDNSTHLQVDALFSCSDALYWRHTTANLAPLIPAGLAEHGIFILIHNHFHSKTFLDLNVRFVYMNCIHNFHAFELQSFKLLKLT